LDTDLYCFCVASCGVGGGDGGGEVSELSRGSRDSPSLWVEGEAWGKVLTGNEGGVVADGDPACKGLVEDSHMICGGDEGWGRGNGEKQGLFGGAVGVAGA